jgi:hypothetical protein
MYEILRDDHPLTIRHVFYRMSNDLRLINKTEAEYDNVVVRLLGKMREDGRIPFRWITDNTRWMIKDAAFHSARDAIERIQASYRQSLWDEQDVYVEVWTEKDAIAGFLSRITKPWDVPLMVVRGYSSKSFLYSCARDIEAIAKPAYLSYFGDWDPSGVHIPQHIEDSLRRYAPEAEIHFERVAVTPEQVEAWQLPTRPTKSSDSRARRFVGESVEIDALPSQRLLDLAERCITRHIDHDVLRNTRRIESLERQTLGNIISQWGGAG